jgi:U3 small nucleolar RNA-associated protein 18
MSRLNAKSMQPREEVEQTDVPVVEDEEYSDSEVELDEASELEKDETEEELEHLVFGDSAGFRERLRSFPQEGAAGGEDDQDITGLEGLDDAEVGQASSLKIYQEVFD